MENQPFTIPGPRDCKTFRRQPRNRDHSSKMGSHALYEPTFARFRRFRAEDRAFARLEQRQFAGNASKGPSKLVVDGGPTLKRAALLVPRHTSPLIDDYLSRAANDQVDAGVGLGA